MTKEMPSCHREDILNDALHFQSSHQKEKIGRVASETAICLKESNVQEQKLAGTKLIL